MRFLQVVFTGATGLEPATSGVTGLFERNDGWRRLTRYRSIDAGLRSLSADLRRIAQPRFRTSAALLLPKRDSSTGGVSRSLCCGSPARIRAGAWDFFTVETVVVRRYYVVFFMEHASRRVLLAGCSSTPMELGRPARAQPRFCFAESGAPL